jgi:micrococcal nuclease
MILACMVALVIDADTFDADCFGERYRIRVANIDSAETRGACLAERRLAAVARSVADLRLRGREVIVRPLYDDRYGRTIARVHIGGVDYGADMVSAGLAEPWPWADDGSHALAPRPEWCE